MSVYIYVQVGGAPLDLGTPFLELLQCPVYGTHPSPLYQNQSYPSPQENVDILG